jgi:hypothetical protein
MIADGSGMTLAYTFWHQPRPEVPADRYERGMSGFHERLAAVPIPGFVDSWTLRVPDLPWLPGGGYEDWYLVADFGALGTLAEHAVDAARVQSHDAMARSVRSGAGGVYALLIGDLSAPAGPGTRSGWAGWFSKQDGVSYPRLRAGLTQQWDDGAVSAVWQRQLVLGPAPEFRVLAAAAVPVAGADLSVGVPVVRSG